MVRFAGAASNSADVSILCAIGSVGVGVSLADAPVIASTILAIVCAIVLSPRFRVHGTVDSLWLVLIAQNVDDNLVADVWLGWGSGRVTTVVGSLGGAGGGASFDTSLISLNCVETEELVAHVCVGVGDWIVGRVDCSTELHGASETGL